MKIFNPVCTIINKIRGNAPALPPQPRAFKPLDPSHVRLDIVVPVYNEAHVLAMQIKTLRAYVNAHVPYRTRIVIADNGSTDQTWQVAQSLHAIFPTEVHAVHLAQKGRGRALKQVWRNSDADILAYMDVDLSTDLSALKPLVQPLIDGAAPIAVGSRLLRDSEVTRGPKREFISRSYNRLLGWTLKLKTGDAQCGFKAIRADAARQLLPEIADNEWFFDTELLARAEQKGWPVHEVPVAWTDDPDSRVKIVKTALDDLRGIDRLRRERGQNPFWEKPALTAVLLSTLALYIFGMMHNGYANSYYSAAVQAASTSWKAFFFGSLDGASFITVDKPPIAIWLMALSARLLGFSSVSMLLPNAIAGAATVWLVYASVKRLFGLKSAFLAAGTMALTPVAAMMFGFNNPDAALTLLLTASAYTFLRALENRRPLWWLSLTGILTGFAFNTKMLQGLIVLPVMALVYLVCAKPKLLTRMWHVGAAGVVTAISTLWWAVAVWLVPAASRPYIGSSSKNSIWDLILGYNGFGRLLGSSSGMSGGGAPGGTGMGAAAGQAMSQVGQIAQTATSTVGDALGQMQGAAPTGGGMGPGGTGFGGSTGILRMFNSDFGPNIGWLIPLALVSAIAVLWLSRRFSRSNQQRAAVLLWTGWLLLHIAVFSVTSGVIHPYYPVVMAPAIAALVGIGVPYMWQMYKYRTRGAWLLPLGVVTTTITSYVILNYQNNWPVVTIGVLIAGGLATLGMCYNLLNGSQAFKRAIASLAVVACAAGPVLFTLATVQVAHTGSIPTAGPSATAVSQTNNESASADSALVTYLLAHQNGATWIVAVTSANESAPIQLSSGQPVMALGGFNGSDNGISLAKFKQYVKEGKIQYVLVSNSGRGGGMGGNGTASSIYTWAESHGTAVNYGGNAGTLYKVTAS